MKAKEDTFLAGCEIICIGEQDTDLIACPLPGCGLPYCLWTYSLG